MINTDSLTTASSTTTLVTVTYADRIGYLRELLSRAFDVEEIARAVIVSNASTSNLELLERQWGPRLRVIRLQQNTGSANGYAAGIAAALADGAPYIWLMDDDNAPKKGALDTLHRHLLHSISVRGAESAAVLGFRPTHQADIANGVDVERAYPPRSSFFGFHYRQIPFKIWRRIRPNKTPRSPARVVAVPYAPYGGLLASSALFERIGLPMCELVLYADDTEYTYRITAGGGMIELVTDAELEDLEGSWNLKEKYPNAFIGWLEGKSDLRAFYAARNQAWFDKHVWTESGVTHAINRLTYHSVLKLLSLKTGKKGRHDLLIKAIRQGELSLLGTSEFHTL